jgi:hypothetical protein
MKRTEDRGGTLLQNWKLSSVCEMRVGRDSSVGIAVRHGLDGSEIEAGWEARFSAPVQTGPGAHPPSYTMGTESFPGGGDKAAEAWRWPSTPSSAEVKERVELYLYPLWALVVCSRVNFYVKWEFSIIWLNCVFISIQFILYFVKKYEEKHEINAKLNGS